jgi:Sulfotransferase family
MSFTSTSSDSSTSQKVVLWLCDKRSGSTAFQSELCKHPQIRHVAYTPHTYYETQYWLKAACLLKMPEQDFAENNYYYSSKVARHYIINLLKGNVPEFSIPTNDEELVFEGWNALVQKFAHPIFFEKSPHHLNHWAALTSILRWIDRTSYEVRIVAMVRNPMAVLSSAWKLFRTPPEKRQFLWAQSYRNLLCFQAMIPSEQFFLLRYEDSIAQPQDTLRSVCDFLELDYLDNLGTAIHANSEHKFRTDPEFTLQLHESVARVARHFGYTEEDLYNPPKPEPSYLRKQQQRTVIWLKHSKARLINRTLRPLIERIDR